MPGHNDDFGQTQLIQLVEGPLNQSNPVHLHHAFRGVPGQLFQPFSHACRQYNCLHLPVLQAVPQTETSYFVSTLFRLRCKFFTSSYLTYLISCTLSLFEYGVGFHHPYFFYAPAFSPNSRSARFMADSITLSIS